MKSCLSWTNYPTFILYETMCYNIAMGQNKMALDIEVFKDLKTFFYQSLIKINGKSLSPIPEGAILYSCDVLERMSLTQDFYELKENGKVSEKILGLNILKAESLDLEQRKLIYKDVADTALVLVGYFPNSINTKIVDKNYYVELGKVAYKKMDSCYPDYLDIPGFYKQLSLCFEGLTRLLKIFSETNKQDALKRLLLNNYDSSELLARGVWSQKTKKVS